MAARTEVGSRPRRLRRGAGTRRRPRSRPCPARPRCRLAPPPGGRTITAITSFRPPGRDDVAPRSSSGSRPSLPRSAHASQRPASPDELMTWQPGTSLVTGRRLPSVLAAPAGTGTPSCASHVGPSLWAGRVPASLDRSRLNGSPPIGPTSDPPGCQSGRPVGPAATVPDPPGSWQLGSSASPDPIQDGADVHLKNGMPAVPGPRCPFPNYR
jgi:hypothetical protein